jgi:hypothetical protein
MFCVLPEFRGKGVESQLITWSFKHFGLDKEYIWLRSSLNERELFLNYGWEHSDYMDIDLSKVRGIERGFGMYRLQAMIRKPGVLSIAEREEE